MYRPRFIDLTGQTISRRWPAFCACGGLVANDSGAMHMAAAVGTSVVALFGPTRESTTPT